MAASGTTFSSQTLKDFEPESFVPEKYIEKLAQMDPNTGLGPLSKKEGVPFDSEVLLASFKTSLSHLHDLSDKINKRVERLEFVCAKQERDHCARVKELEPMFQVWERERENGNERSQEGEVARSRDCSLQDAFNEFQVLEDRITYVARKVVHLGDQLETLNIHRQRDIEAHRLMDILTEFKEKSKPSCPEFNDATKLPEAADLINKLHTLVSELPKSLEYQEMRANISERYSDIEQQLVGKFYEALSSSDVKRMKVYASTLQNFPEGYRMCITNYIAHHITTLSQSGNSVTEDVFRNVETRSIKVYKQTVEVFDAPEDIMMKYIQQATEKYLFEHVSKELDDALAKSIEQYLYKLFQLHLRAMILRDSLVRLDNKFDPVFLTKLLRVSLFSDHLSGYAESEVRNLEKKCHMFVEEFNSSVGIVKKANNASRATGQQMMIFDSLGSPDEAFISENVCTSILSESKSSIKRCKELLMDRELSHAMRDIFLTVFEVLSDHFTTALDLAIDVKVAPTGLFLQVVGCINKNIHLVEKQFREIILPAIQYAPVAAACNEKKRSYMTKLETRIEAGTEKSVAGMVTSLSQILSTQKKSDYKPDEPGVPEISPVCTKAVSHITQCTKVIKMSFDGKNQEIILLEFGIKVHRVLFEHILTFSVSSAGAMFLICDVNEYRKGLKEFGIRFLDEVFENLQTLCNLFIVKPENLKQVCSEEPYVSFDRNVIMRMIQLRTDFKTSKIGKLFNH